MLFDSKIKNCDVLLNSNGEYEAKNHRNQYLVAFCSQTALLPWSSNVNNCY